MNLISLFSFRHFFSRKSSSAVNIISLVAVFGIAVATFALVVVLSAFNGLQSLVESLYEDAEADLKIMPARGKWIDITAPLMDEAKSADGIEYFSPVVEELALVKYDVQQSPCRMKGVEGKYIERFGISEKIIEGTASLGRPESPMAIVGFGLASVLNIYVRNAYQGLKFYAPRITKGTPLNPADAFRTKTISASSLFMNNPDIDNDVVFVPLSFAQELFGRKGQATAIELKVKDGAEAEVKERLMALLGEAYTVKTRVELNELVYQTNQAEKAVTFFILVFILVIATSNIASSLTMILLEKEKDISTLRILGMDTGMVRRIFIAEGMLINGSGITIGLLTGLALCLVQINYGLVRLEGGIVEFYPVKLLAWDFFIVILTALTTGFLASYLPSRLLVKET